MAELGLAAPDHVVLKDRHAVIHICAGLAMREAVEETAKAQSFSLLSLLRLPILLAPSLVSRMHAASVSLAADVHPSAQC